MGRATVAALVALVAAWALNAVPRWVVDDAVEAWVGQRARRVQHTAAWADRSGVYESFFVRANEADIAGEDAGARSLWARYTVFRPHPDAANATETAGDLCELWAVVSTRSGGGGGGGAATTTVVAAGRDVWPLHECTFDPEGRWALTPQGGFHLDGLDDAADSSLPAAVREKLVGGAGGSAASSASSSSARFFGRVRLRGELEDGRRPAPDQGEEDGKVLAWDVAFDDGEEADRTAGSDDKPLFVLPSLFFPLPFPPAKAVTTDVPRRLKGHAGVIQHRSEEKGALSLPASPLPAELALAGPGSFNHNYGARHTHEYAWGQVIGFGAERPGLVLEVATARPQPSLPQLTILTLRDETDAGRKDHYLNGLLRGLLFNDGTIAVGPELDTFTWSFSAGTVLDPVHVNGTLSAPRDAFAALTYLNPPGGARHCLNSKIARAELTIVDRVAGTTEHLVSESGAAFEIAGNDNTDWHGLDVLL